MPETPGNCHSRRLQKMKQKSPKKLFVCLLKNRHSVEDIKNGIIDIRNQGRYMTDLWQKGIFWAGGPAVGQTAIQIYSVDSLDDAVKAQRNAPMYIEGSLYEDKYLESERSGSACRFDFRGFAGGAGLAIGVVVDSVGAVADRTVGTSLCGGAERAGGRHCSGL